MTARMDNFVLVIVQNVWSTFIIQVMQKLRRQKGNMTVHTWQDFYMCKYSYRYTSEIIYALEWMPSLSSEKNLKVLSFGCGPCTDLFAIDYLRVSGKLCYQILDYRGVDYSRDVCNFIHNDIKIV